MYTTEGKLRASLVMALRCNKVLAQPIESGTTGLGIPDLFIRTTKYDVWAELKNTKYHITYPYTVPFRPGQYKWLKEHYMLGGFSLLIVGTMQGVCVFKNKNIHKIYERSLEECCDFFMQPINGKAFIEWMNLQ